MKHITGTAGFIRFAGLIVAAALTILTLGGAPAAPLPGGGDSTATAPAPAAADGPPAGLSAADWSGIQDQIAARGLAVVADADGHRARNPGQQWLTRFDARGFLVEPDHGTWRWGLEFQGLGPVAPAGADLPATAPRVSSDGNRLAYDWTDEVQEWFVNDRRGLEHGLTLRARPPGLGETLELRFGVRGDLRPQVKADGGDLCFLDPQGACVLSYAGLKVTDADGTVLPAAFTVVGQGLRLVVTERGARYPLIIDPIAQQAYIKASNTGSGDYFGSSVAIAGDTLVVGAPYEDSSATGINGGQSDNTGSSSGAAYVFVRSAGVWTQQAYLKASNTGAEDHFGIGVAITGDTVVVGASDEDSNATGVDGSQTDNSATNSGAAYVFVRSGTTWTQQAYLKASNTGAGDQFGLAVAITDNTVVVGAYQEDSYATGINGDQSDNTGTDPGAAYVFVRSGTTWTQQAYLKASNTGAGDQFGYAVAITGDTAVVGARWEASSATGVNGNQANNSALGSGAVYVFVRSGTTWTQQAYLKASNTGRDDMFGGSVAISGGTLVVGAYGEGSSATGVDGNGADNSAYSAGAAYVFIRSGTLWSQQAYLKASNTAQSDYFGVAVAITGDTLAVGADGEDSNATGVDGIQTNNGASRAGAVYFFGRSGTVWSQRAYIKASNTGGSDAFGSAIAMSGNTLIVAADGESSSATGIGGNQANYDAPWSGAVYAFFDATLTTTTLAASPNPAVLGASVTLTATVTPALATGIVTFRDSATTLGTGTLSGGTATYSAGGLGAGTHSITAVYSGDSTYATSTSAVLTQTIDGFNQATLTVTGPASVTYGSTGTATTSGGSGTGALSYSAGASTGCAVGSSTGVVSVSNATGTCALTATKAADGTYNATTSAAYTVTLNKASQAALSLTGPASVTYGGTGTATTSGGSGTGALSYSAGASTGCSIDGSTGVVAVSNASGTCAITATKAADSNYNSATSTAYTVTLNKATQTLGAIGFSPAGLGVSGRVTASAAPGASGSPVVYSSLTGAVCTASGGTVTGVTAGPCTIAADQAGTDNYLAAPQVTASLTVAAAPTLSTPTISRTAASLATLDLQADHTGTGWFTLLAGVDADCGSGAQVQAGLDANGDPAPYRGTLALIAATLAHYSVRNLSEDTAYTLCFTAGGDNSLQGSPATAGLRTTAMVDVTAPGWGPVGGTGLSAGQAADLALVFGADATPYVAYRDGSVGDQATVMTYAEGAWTPLGGTLIAPGVSAGAVAGPRLALAPDESLYLAYQDLTQGGKATVLRYDGAAWAAVGSAGFSTGTAAGPALAVGVDGYPLVAFTDGSEDGRASVWQYRDGAWGVLGTAGLSDGTATALRLSVTPNGTPTLAYLDGSTSPAGKTTVMQYTGGGWVPLGATGFSTATAADPALAVAPDGRVYLAYQDADQAYKATAMAAGEGEGAWSAVGNPGLSAGSAADLSLALAPNGEAVLAYRDAATSPAGRATVMRYSGDAWSALGNTALSTGTAANLALADAPDGTPWLAYRDGAAGNKATVMRLTETVTITVATTPPGLAFRADGVGYSATQDFSWAPGTVHTLALTSPQVTGGTRHRFLDWSDGGALSHTITTPAAPTAYTAGFATDYQLTIAANPATIGAVLPSNGTWYAAGSLVPISVTPKTGYQFIGWTGAVANAMSATTTVLMDAPRSLVANLTGAATLRAQVTTKSGSDANRVWGITVTNSGTGTAGNVELTAVGITTWSGPACTPTLKTALPVTVGDVAPGTPGSSAVTLDFSGCTAATRFKLGLGYRFGAGATGTTSYTNIQR